jgi:hypothetical protein
MRCIPRQAVPVPADRRHSTPSQGEAPAGRLHRLRRIALLVAAAIAATGSFAISPPVSAVEEAKTFGAPTVLSARGQRLKVVLPVTDGAGDRSSAVTYFVERTQAASGYDSPAAAGFTVMRPDRSPYVVFQSEEVVDAPAVSLTFTVAGDPRSPYQMDLAIPAASFSQPEPLARVAAAGRGAGVPAIGVRRIDGPPPRKDLPPK